MRKKNTHVKGLQIHFEENNVLRFFRLHYTAIMLEDFLIYFQMEEKDKFSGIYCHVSMQWWELCSNVVLNVLIEYVL